MLGGDPLLSARTAKQDFKVVPGTAYILIIALSGGSAPSPAYMLSTRSSEGQLST